jgi:hypothetical protein
MTPLMTVIGLRSEEFEVCIGSYAEADLKKNNGVAIFLFKDGSPFIKLTVCCPNQKLDRSEIIVKTYSENASHRDWILNLGLFKDTGRRIKSGFIQLEVWKFTNVMQSKLKSITSLKVI